MDWDDEPLQEDEMQKQKQKQRQTVEQDSEDEGTQMYAERPAFVALDAQENVFDHGSLNRQHGINTQPSIFNSTWK